MSQINTNVRLFADDTSLYVIVETPDQAATALNTDLEAVHCWSKTWLVSFNPSKTESIIFSRKRKKPEHPSLYMNNVAIKNVSSHMHLGVTFSEDLKWSSHISFILKKAWQRIGMMKTVKHFLNRSSLERMYFSFIRPLLEYSDVVWDNCTETLKHEIEAVHNEAARIVTGATKYCNIQKLLCDLKWETLAARRRKHRLILLYKMLNGLSPTYLSNLIPGRDQTDPGRYNLRSIRCVNARTQSYSSSFLPRTIREWNTLPQSTRNAASLSQFKSVLNRTLQKSSPLLNFGTRKGQILHARLRLGCSSLNHDLHRRSLIDSPLCSCGQIETVDHYLLYCPKYHELRNQNFYDIPCPLITSNLLNGNEHLTFEQNKYIFACVHHFILASKRFSS